jgi:hypothetical protein
MEWFSWSNRSLLFPEKEAKSVCSASQKAISYRKLGEADPGVWGLPQETNWCDSAVG